MKSYSHLPSDERCLFEKPHYEQGLNLTAAAERIGRIRVAYLKKPISASSLSKGLPSRPGT